MAILLNQNSRLGDQNFKSRTKDTSYLSNLYNDYNKLYTKMQTDVISRPDELTETRKIKQTDYDKGSTFFIDITPPKKGGKKADKPKMTKTGKIKIDVEPPPPPPIVEEPTKLDGKLFKEEDINMMEDLLSKYGQTLYDKLSDLATGKGRSERKKFGPDVGTKEDIEERKRAREALDAMNRQEAEEAESNLLKEAYEAELTARQKSEMGARLRSEIEPRMLFDRKLEDFEKFQREFTGREKRKYKTEPINFKNHKKESDDIKISKQILNSLKMKKGKMDNNSRMMARLQTEKQKYRTKLNTIPTGSVGYAVVMPYGAQSFSLTQGAV